MAHHKVTVDRLKLFGALRRSRKQFPDDIDAINKIIDNMKKDSENHYLSISQDDINRVSYAKNKGEKYNQNKRIETTFGRYVRRKIDIGNEELSDTVLSNLSQFIIIAAGKNKTKKPDDDENIKLLTGYDIVKFYASTYRCLHTCMTGKKKSPIIKFYALNPDKVALVTTKNKQARALVWTTDEGRKVLDRIYPYAGNNYNNLRIWANNNKIQMPIFKDRVTMKHNGYFPYMDRFVYGRVDNVLDLKKNKEGTVVLSTELGNSNIMLRRQDGTFNIVPRCIFCDKTLKYDWYSVYKGNKKYYCCYKCLNKTEECRTCRRNIIKDDFEFIEESTLFKNLFNKRQCSRCRSIESICYLCNKHTKYSNSVKIEGRFVCLDCLKSGI